jgi:hypothetical protein
MLGLPTGTQLRQQEKITAQVCPHWLKEGHDADAVFYKFCGSSLDAYECLRVRVRAKKIPNGFGGCF